VTSSPSASPTPFSDRAPITSGPRGWTFLAEAAREPRATGAVAPSGKILAHLLTEPVRTRAGGNPLDVLEVGAGTGPVTRALIASLSVGSRLDIVEANPRFVERLRHLVRTHPCLAQGVESVGVHEAYMEQWETPRRYDVIVSGLPFANFAPEQVDALMRRYLELLRPGGVLTYFAYRGTRAARSLLSPRGEVRRHRAVEDVLAAHRCLYATSRRTVWSNLPPARVWQLRRPMGRTAEVGP
jgi:phosphatidylethanolamine/phosphatidyl-N-methylethanolamine N-methyltransferase